MEAVDGLRKVRLLLDDEDRWIKHEIAVDADGNNVASKSEKACKWCLIGAVYNCIHDMKMVLHVKQKLRDVLPLKYVYSLSDFNDSDDIGHSDVLEIVDKAIDAVLACSDEVQDDTE